MDAFCLLLSNFALEYRTTFGKVVAKNERKKQERDRNKTKGKFIVSSFGQEPSQPNAIFLSPSEPQNKVKDVAGKGDKKSSSRKQGAEETDTAESDLVAQLANAVVKDDKRRVKDGVKARRKGGKAKKKISKLTNTLTAGETTIPLLSPCSSQDNRQTRGAGRNRECIGGPGKMMVATDPSSHSSYIIIYHFSPGLRTIFSLPLLYSSVCYII